MRLPVEGGPADGLEIPAIGDRRWIDPVRRRGYSTPGPGRSLYLRMGRAWVAPRLEWWVCSCGALLLERTESCRLCGAERSSDG